jgi:hypothetical protein
MDLNLCYSKEEKRKILKDLLSIKTYLLNLSKDFISEEYVDCRYPLYDLSREDFIEEFIRLSKDEIYFSILYKDENAKKILNDLSEETIEEISSKYDNDNYSRMFEYFASIIVEWPHIKKSAEKGVDRIKLQHNKLKEFIL